jgi:hypothetical protein
MQTRCRLVSQMYLIKVKARIVNREASIPVIALFLTPQQSEINFYYGQHCLLLEVNPFLLLSWQAKTTAHIGTLGGNRTPYARGSRPRMIPLSPQVHNYQTGQVEGSRTPTISVTG